MQHVRRKKHCESSKNGNARDRARRESEERERERARESARVSARDGRTRISPNDNGSQPPANPHTNSSHL